MDLPRNAFKHAIAAGTPQLGAWLMSAAPSTAEALGCVGFDFLVVDMEHTPIDTPQMIGILRAIAGTPASAITRLPWNDAVMVKRALDAGAQTLLFPFVQNATEAARAVASTRYPPDGIRGAAGVHRGSRYGTVPGYFKAAASEICVAVQVETLQALDNLEAIANVPGVDSVFVGPGDLSASMGHLGDIAHADVQAKLAHAAAVCKRLGKPTGIIGPNPEMVERFAKYGYNWIAVGSDMSMMVGRAQEWLGKLRGGTAPAPKAQGPY
ncbi:MAG TPA: HpcH/HpaI aldolase/citrate lyase family protein [Casimicrobiaceae bacterium]|jgi:2-dehydro-3-deoxyglucarate aldolase/4-hydroxy-2-oxoheptanedioate aldolase